MTIGSGVATAPVLLRQDQNGVARLTLNRAQARNSLSRSLMQAMQSEFDRLAQDKSITVVVIDAAGPVFCSGHDLKELRAHATPAFYQDTFQECSRLMQSILALPQPVIAQVQGMATAAGCQLVASCDLAVAAESARFATPGVNIGLFCSTPMVALSRAVGRKQTMEMLLTGDAIDAQTAERWGLVNRVVPDEALATQTMNLAQKIVEKSPHTLAIGKKAFYRQADMPLAQAYEYTSAVMVENMLAQDAEEGIDAFLQKRAPQWKGC